MNTDADNHRFGSSLHAHLYVMLPTLINAIRGKISFLYLAMFRFTMLRFKHKFDHPTLLTCTCEMSIVVNEVLGIIVCGLLLLSM